MQSPLLTAVQKSRQDADLRRYALCAANEVFGHKPAKAEAAEAFIVVVVAIVALLAAKGCT